MPVLEPFDMTITIENKREIMDKMATSWFGGFADYLLKDESFTDKVVGKLVALLPPGLEEAGITCTLEKKPSHGLTGRVTMDITGYDLEKVLTKAKGEEFADAILSLQETLAGLGMPEKYAEISHKIGKMLRASLMRKIPGTLVEKMAEQGVRATASVDPPPPPEEEPPTEVERPNMDLMFRMRIPSREPIVKDIDSRIAAAALAAMPQRKFLALIEGKLKEKISGGVQEKLGDAVPMTVETESDDHAGADGKDDSFWLRISIDAVDTFKLLKHAKGEEFATHFANLIRTLETLQRNGVETMRIVLSNIYSNVDAKVVEGLSRTLAIKMKESLGADMLPVSPAGYMYLKEMAPQGRCCGFGETVWWVDADQARGSGAFNLGYGRSGHCPTISPGGLCAARGLSQPQDAVKSEYRQFTDCFHIGAAGNLADVTRLVALDVNTEC